MPVCVVCDRENREGARFCWNCAAPLAGLRPNDDDRQWLAASLAHQGPGGHSPAATGATGPLGQVGPAEEESMDQQAPALFAGRYELPPGEQSGTLTVVDTAPWRRCWACGSTANEPGDAFCNDCGAALEPRSYRATLTPRDEPAGAALVAAIDDEAARAALPEIAEQVTEGDRVLTLVHDSGRPPLAAPLDETAALAVGRDLAHLAAHLHALGLALGAVEPEDLEAVPGGGARLRSVNNLRPFAADEATAAVQSDLTALAELLEQLNATPRTTQRLTEDEAAQAIAEGEAGLSTVLREVRTGALADAQALATRLEAILAERTHPVPLRQLVGAHSDTGMVREHNEDSCLTLQLGLDNNNQRQAWGVYMVSDGMGGHAAGEVASGLAIRGAADLMLSEYLARQVQPDAAYSEGEAEDLVRRAILQANERVVEESRAQGNDMGATMTMAIVAGDRVVVGNVGDSRAYLLRDGQLRRISKDHSLVQRLVDLGQISDEEVYTHPQRNAVLRSLGDRSEVEVDLFSERVRPGDALFLCSDGQWEMTRDPEMARLIAEAPDPQAACEALVEAANQAGGEDNITVVLVRLV
ncbi:MAG TPA: Stp1/IreP family PP2C-type Ser/Thr phosphatase [Chloroflexaceae bacterium]|nr:Stp1/IreP family PP2C-type Ser/Thr phosphatase [Chloroflexaceae bacterium]